MFYYDKKSYSENNEGNAKGVEWYGAYTKQEVYDMVDECIKVLSICNGLTEEKLTEEYFKLYPKAEEYCRKMDDQFYEAAMNSRNPWGELAEKVKTEMSPIVEQKLIVPYLQKAIEGLKKYKNVDIVMHYCNILTDPNEVMEKIKNRPIPVDRIKEIIHTQRFKLEWQLMKNNPIFIYEFLHRYLNVDKNNFASVMYSENGEFQINCDINAVFEKFKVLPSETGKETEN